MSDWSNFDQKSSLNVSRQAQLLSTLTVCWATLWTFFSLRARLSLGRRPRRRLAAIGIIRTLRRRAWWGASQFWSLHANHWIMSYHIFGIYRVHMASDHCMYLQKFRSLETAHRTGACVQFPFSTSYQMGSIPSEFSTKQKKRSLIVSSLASWKHKFSLAHLELRDLLSECFSFKETWGPALYWLPKILVVRPSSSF